MQECACKTSLEVDYCLVTLVTCYLWRSRCVELWSVQPSEPDCVGYVVKIRTAFNRTKEQTNNKCLAATFPESSKQANETPG
eukprot:417579-Amphidinium_carterae.2